MAIDHSESGFGQSKDSGGQPQVFVTTHWSVVLAAGDQKSPQADAAIEILCRTYWYPIYAYVRRRGYAEADAKDVTQGFFQHLLERSAFQRLSPEKGKFRSFLLAALNYFISDDRDRTFSQKRGGGKVFISLDAQEAEERYRSESVTRDSPDRIFEQCWALTLLDQVMMQLKSEFVRAGKVALWERLSCFLVENRRAGTRADAARDLGLTEEAVKKTVHEESRRTEEQRQRAVKSEEEMRAQLYGANMNLAQQAWEQNNIARLEQLLEETKDYSDRGFEWFYWKKQLKQERWSFRTQGTTDDHPRIQLVAFSPNGQTVLGWGENQEFRLWDLSTGRETLALHGTRPAFSPDGFQLVFGRGNSVVIWDLKETAQPHEVLPSGGPENRTPPKGGAKSMVSPDRRMAELDATGPVLGALFSPDGRFILTAGNRDRTARV